MRLLELQWSIMVFKIAWSNVFQKIEKKLGNGALQLNPKPKDNCSWIAQLSMYSIKFEVCIFMSICDVMFWNFIEGGGRY